MTGFLHVEPTEDTAAFGLVRLASPAPDDGVRAALPLSVTTVDSVDTFTALSTPAGDLIANGRVLKFLVDLRTPDQPAVSFVNGNFTQNGTVPDSAKYHYFFARATLGIPESLAEFNEVTYFTAEKRYAAGVVHSYLLEGRAAPVYGIQFYPQDVIAEQGVVDVVLPVAAAIGIPAAAFAFVAAGLQQTVATVTGQLTAASIEALTLDQVLGAVNYIPLNAGEAWGYLRIFPGPATRLAPADIPVFEELPLDLSVVAGVITKAVQDSNSHVNLKSKERGTPNMVLRDAGPDSARLAEFADQPVHFVVGPGDFLLEPSTDEEVAAKLAERADRPLVPLEVEPETQVRSYDEMAAGTAAATLAMGRRYGGKAANLAFLAHRDVLGRATDEGSASHQRGYDLVPFGFGVPLSYYQNLVADPANTAARAALKAFVAAEHDGILTPDERASLVDVVQTGLLNAVIPEADRAAAASAFESTLPGIKKVKVRSSANAEDVPNFDGAGLHDSFAATVTKKENPDGSCAFEVDEDPGGEVKRKVSPKSIGCAVKGVYASLWNQRAVEERSFARIDSSTVAMGLAVVPEYDTEAEVVANAVVVTRVLNAEGVFGYSISVQQGNNLVTNPDPGTESEVTVAAIGLGAEPTSLTVTRFALPVAGGPRLSAPVLSRLQMLDIVDVAATVERAYCRAKPDYYPGQCRFVVIDNDKPASLDLELKVLDNGQLVVKQVREFRGR